MPSPSAACPTISWAKDGEQDPCLYPSANITPIDYDPSATRVNQENRIKLMLAVAKERLNAPAQAAPMTAEEIAGGAPRVETTV